MIHPFAIILAALAFAQPQVATPSRDKMPTVYYVPFDIDTSIAITSENFAIYNPSRNIKVGASDLKIVLRYLAMTLPPCKEDPLKYGNEVTRLLIQFPDETIAVDTEGVAGRGKTLARMTPSAFLRLNGRLEQLAYVQGKSLNFRPRPQE